MITGGRPLVASPRTRTQALTAGLAALFLVLAILLQWTGGAYRAEFGAYPDEAAHYVTGLMIHDYLAGGFPGNPMAFAQKFYDHYPKVALGNWPPLYYLMQGGWMLVFSPGRVSVLLLMAVLTALIATVVARALLREFGPWPAVAGGLLFLAIPFVQQYSSLMMTEIPVALFSILATLSFGRFLERGRTFDSVAFGLFASAASLTKGSGFVLALVPPLAILFSGRFDVLRRPAFWYPVVIVAVLAGPWTWVFRDVARAGWEESAVTLDYTRRAAVRFPLALYRMAHPIVSLLSIAGLVIAALATRRGWLPVRWAAVPALVVAVVAFHAIVPASLDVRHMVQALPACAMLAVVSVMLANLHLRTAAPRWRWAPAAIGAVGLAMTAWPIQAKTGAGYDAVVEQIVKAPDHADAVFLVSSDAIGEGMFIAETAMRERRPGHVIRRASKLLADQKWHGGGYQPKVEQSADLVALLRKERIRFVVVDYTIPSPMRLSHHALLTETLHGNHRDFRRRAGFAITRGYPRSLRHRVYHDGVLVYEVLPAAPAQPGS